MTTKLAIGLGAPCLALLLTACATPQVVTRPDTVTVTKHAYLAVPEKLLAPCPSVPADRIQTNGDLWAAYLAERASISRCNGQLDAIRHLTPPKE
jgi:hypothetical protein